MTSYKMLATADGRSAAIIQRRGDVLVVEPLAGAMFRPGETVRISGRSDGAARTAEFVVGARCGPRKRRVRLRAVRLLEP
jgi:hypothetical protein